MRDLNSRRTFTASGGMTQHNTLWYYNNMTLLVCQMHPAVADDTDVVVIIL